MLNDLLRRLSGDPDTPPLDADDAQLALAALMVRLARTDGQYTGVERRIIDRLLAERYGLGPTRVLEVRTEAERAEAEAPDTVSFTRVVKGDVPHEEREAVVEALWRVALSDGIDAEERGFLRLVANLLGVTDQDSGLARQRVERKLDGSEA